MNFLKKKKNLDGVHELSVTEKRAFFHAKSGNLSKLKEYIETHNVSLEIRDNESWNLFHHAANSGITSCVEYLLSRGANVNAQCGKGSKSSTFEGWSALHIAAFRDDEEMVRVLLSRGIDRHIKSKGKKKAEKVGKKKIKKMISNQEKYVQEYIQKMKENQKKKAQQRKKEKEEKENQPVPIPIEELEIDFPDDDIDMLLNDPKKKEEEEEKEEKKSNKTTFKDETKLNIRIPPNDKKETKDNDDNVEDEEVLFSPLSPIPQTGNDPLLLKLRKYKKIINALKVRNKILTSKTENLKKEVFSLEEKLNPQKEVSEEGETKKKDEEKEEEEEGIVTLKFKKEDGFDSLILGLVKTEKILQKLTEKGKTKDYSEENEKRFIEVLKQIGGKGKKTVEKIKMDLNDKVNNCLLALKERKNNRLEEFSIMPK